MYLSISCDHRVVDGAEAALFVKEVIRYLENPTLLLVTEGF
jgi:pyruvate dehydrogenase E2 component (dihydrolipoamide acetyltransferase)